MQSQEQEQLQCPRCNSTNTKFCYYNNYNLSQPRHFCKSCRRYWTKGGALRNIPVGGGTRKNSKRPKSNNTSVEGEEIINPAKRPATSSTISDSGFNGYGEMLDVSGSFSSLLASNGHFGSVVVGENSRQQVGGSHDATEQLMLGLKGDGSSEWPNLSIFTPHSRFP